MWNPLHSQLARIVPITTILTLGCGPDEVESGMLDCDTDDCDPPSQSDDGSASADETGGGEPERVCSVFDGDDQLVAGNTVRWHCSGVGRAKIKAVLDIDAPEWAVSQDVLDYVASEGLDQQVNFGPAYGADFDDPAVIACCEDEYDYANTPQPESEDAEHAWACAVDCIDQTCRALPRLLRDFADDDDHSIHLKNNPFGCALDIGDPCYYDQIWSLANYIASHHAECASAFLNEETPSYTFQVIGLGGTLDLDDWIATHDPGAEEAWPAVTGVAIDGECGISGPDAALGAGWQLPPGDPLPCTDSNDNNDEDPFESGHGGGFFGPDTFVVASGEVELDGPTYLGINADGVAPMVGSETTDCEQETCTWASASVNNGTVYLQDLQVIAPPSLTYEAAGFTLEVDDFRLHLDHARSTVLEPVDAKTSSFSFPPGELKVIASGKLYGVPVYAQVWNSGPVTGTVVEQGTETFDLSLAPLTLQLFDTTGQPWTLDVRFDGWVSHRRAPRARFNIMHLGSSAYFDASASSDGDGDALEFTWYVDGVEAGDRPVISVPWDPTAIHVVALHVLDATGRDDWAFKLFENDA